MLTGPPRRRRARPVADAPIDALLERSEDLAKGWLLALLEQAPLGDAPKILAADLSRDGPRICDAMVRAIGDDADQRRLEPGEALAPLAARIGELAGAQGAAATSQAVDALQAVIWLALRSELRDPDPDLVSELALRLGQVTELMRTAALNHADARAAPAPSAPDLSATVARPVEPERLSFAARRASEADLDADLRPPPVTGRSRPERSWVGGERSEDALWVHALSEQIQRAADTPLSLLLAELEDADRIVAVETDPHRSASTLGQFTQAVRAAVRRHDILVCEAEARAWIIAPDTGRPGAHALGERISSSVAGGPAWRGAPMAASIGVAVLGEDGSTPGELIEAAEEARFAASANGVGLLAPQPPPDS